MRNLFNGFMLACLLSLNTGCIGLIGAHKLTTEQIAAMKDYNDQFDVYVCGLIEGGTRDGNLTFVLLPKGAPVNIQFGPDCHGQIVSGVPPSGIMTPRSSR